MTGKARRHEREIAERGNFGVLRNLDLRSGALERVGIFIVGLD